MVILKKGEREREDEFFTFIQAFMIQTEEGIRDDIAQY